MIKKPEAVVGALIKNPEGKIFLMTSPKWPGRQVVPGGKVEYGENLEDAVRREIREETGLTVHAISFLGIQESIFNPEYHERRHFIFFDYVCKVGSFENVKLNEEGIGYAWVTPEEALAMTLGTSVRTLIELYMKSQFYE